MNSIWLAIAISGALTFLTRFSFISVAGRWNSSPGFRRALQFVPVAVLSAIVSSEIFIINGRFQFSPLNPRLIAGAVAILIALRSRNTILTIVTGMIVFWIVGLLR